MLSPSPSTLVLGPNATTSTATTTHANHHRHHHSKSMPTSPGTASSGRNAGRPPLMKRQSSQSSHAGSRPGLTSPAASEQLLQHHSARVKPRHHGAKVVLPRNHSSARNLVKMNKQAQGSGQHLASDDGRRHARQRSHEGDTEIRLPGSLDESAQSRPAMRRNLTAYQLPRTQSQSQVKLKKNLSHGQLSKLGGGHSGSNRNLASMGGHSTRAPISPGLRGRSKRHKSAEITPAEYGALQERKASGQERKASGLKTNAAKKVGFDVGGEEEGGEYRDDDDETGIKQLDMEGSGLQEDDWTEESASASPYSTRQNTANNSRRTSVNLGAKERAMTAATPSDLLAAKVSEGMQRKKIEPQRAQQEVDESEDSSDEEDASPRTMARMSFPPTRKPPVEQQTLQQHSPVSLQRSAEQSAQRQHVSKPPSTSVHDYAQQGSNPATQVPSHQTAQEPQQQPMSPQPPQQPSSTKAPQISFAPPIYQQETARGHTQLVTHATAPPHSPVKQDKGQAQQPKKEYANPAAKRLTSQQHLLSPAVVTNVSALDSHHSNTGSPAPSLRSSRSNLGGERTTDMEREDDELVSCFVPSASHPSLGSGANTALNTPKQGSGFHTPEEHHSIPRDRSGFHIGPTSPGSTVSGSSGHTTPAHGMVRSRTELRLLQEKALADLESRAEIHGGAKPVLPGHVYDRRNESLKYFMSNAEQHNGSGLSMGPQIFQGRFRAVNTELRVVQKFRDPIGEAIARLRGCKGSRLHRPSSSTGVAKPSAGLSMSKSAGHLPSAQRGNALSKSASPPKSGMAMKRSGQSQVGLGGPTGGGSERQQSRRGVSFAGGPPKMREIPSRDEAPNGMSNADIAKVAQELWNDL